MGDGGLMRRGYRTELTKQKFQKLINTNNMKPKIALGIFLQRHGPLSYHNFGKTHKGVCPLICNSCASMIVVIRQSENWVSIEFGLWQNMGSHLLLTTDEVKPSKRGGGVDRAKSIPFLEFDLICVGGGEMSWF